MAASDPPSPPVLAALHYLQDRCNYGRTWPETTRDAYLLQWYFIKRLLGWPVEWPLPQIAGLPGVTPQVVDVAGVSSIRADAAAALIGNVVLASGSGILLSEAGQTITVATTGTPIGTQLAYVEFTSNVTVSGSEGAPTNIVSAGAVTFDGATRVKVEFAAPAAQAAVVAGADVVWNLWDDTTTDLGRLGIVQAEGGASALAFPIYSARIFTPPAATKTYRVRAWQSGGNGSIQVGAGGAGTRLPGFIRITTV